MSTRRPARAGPTTSSRSARTGAKAARARRPTSPIGSADPNARTAGFLLLDLAFALTILLLVVAIIWPLVGRGSSNVQQAATALDIATVLRIDRSSATRDGIATGTRIDLGRRTITGASGRKVEIPNDLAVEMTTGSRCIEGAQRYVIMFAPDGSSCGGVLTLRKGNQAYAIRIHWLSGMIDVVSLPKA